MPRTPMLVLSALLSAGTAVPAHAANEVSLKLEKAAALNGAASEQQFATLGGLFDGSRFLGRAAGPRASSVGISLPQLREMMLQNLDFVSMTFKSQYAPAEWKRAHHGWDLDAEIRKAKLLVRAHPALTLKEYQAILRRVILSTRDYHVSISFATTEKATLPFRVAGSEGRYFLVWIDRAKLPESSFPFHEGDELVLFGGQKTADVVKAVQAGVGNNVPGTDRALAAYFLTLRSTGRVGGPTPKGPITIAVRPKGTDKLLTRQLIWDYTPEMVGDGMKLASLGDLAGGEGRSKLPLPWLDDMLSPQAKDTPNQGNPFGLGNREGFLPPLGLKIWESAPTDAFDAYIYKGKDGRLIGYLRIPSYVPADPNKAVADFAKVVGKFEAATDALVIDQLNNPGGSVFYLYSLVSMLSDQAVATPRHRIAISQSDVVQAAQFLAQSQTVNNSEDAKKLLGPTLGGYPVDYELYRHMLDFSRFIVDQWNAGKRLTDPIYLWGVDSINPSAAARYTKPILLLTNELDFSGGDFFPAILQDNKRAVVFGARTAGAGGFVRQVEFPNQLGIDMFSMTGSIAERVDRNPIENLGVKPDIARPMTPADYQNAFKDYLQAVNDAVNKLIK